MRRSRLVSSGLLSLGRAVATLAAYPERARWTGRSRSSPPMRPDTDKPSRGGRC